FKTKGVVQILDALKATGKTMVVVEEINDVLDIAVRNLPNVTTVTCDHTSVYDLLNADVVIATEAALKKFEEVLS
ncbi:MAG: 50S ribosomal protein L4, partial [Candidatus Izemoplasmatales bacterium]